ncbi:hypothetical protein H8E88_33405 [candidate division KSB1 bacterium]|nr:hypothetical protein [candidate division KSB1 bacterium]
MIKNVTKLPAFKTLKEIEEFWESHEYTDFQVEFEEIKHPQVEIKDRTYLPITLTMYEKLEKIALQLNTTVDSLIHHWVQEKLAEF